MAMIGRAQVDATCNEIGGDAFGGAGQPASPRTIGVAPRARRGRPLAAGFCFLASTLVAASLAGQEAAVEKEKEGAEDGEAVVESAQPAGATAEEIVVVGERLEESIPLELEEYGAEVHVVDRQEILDGGFIDVAGALQSEVPGLYLAPKNGPFDYVNASLQGSRTKEILWLVDGVRISNRLYDTTTPLDTLPSHMVERIEVLEGGQSLFYGTQAVGGVINVVTRSPSARADGALSLGLDSNDGTHLDGQARGGGGVHRFVAYASNDEADGFQPFRDEHYQPSSTDRERGYDVLTVGGRYRAAVRPELLLSAQVQHTDATLDFAAAEDRAESFNERDELIASVKLDWSPTDRFDLFAKAYWHDWDATFTQLDNDLENPGALVVVDDHAVWQFSDSGLNLAGELAASDEVSLLFGYDYQSYDGRDDVFLIAPQSENVSAVFGQARFAFDALRGVHLALGARHNEPSDGQSKTVWNVSSRMAFTERLYGRAQVGTAFRLPSAYELYVVDPCCEQGNPDLVGEESFNVEAAVGGERPRFRWEGVIFSRRVEDLIDIAFDLPDFPDGLIVNTEEEVEVFGWELVGGFELGKAVRATASYQRTEAEAGGSSDQIPDIPLDLARLALDWRSDALPLVAGLVVRHVGDVFDTVGGGIGRVEHGNYTVADLAGAYTLAERHRIGLRLENVLDEEYDTSFVRVRRDADGSSYAAGNLGAPRTLYATYSIAF
jgi:vitamin B12 transporter